MSEGNEKRADAGKSADATDPANPAEQTRGPDHGRSTDDQGARSDSAAHDGSSEDQGTERVFAGEWTNSAEGGRVCADVTASVGTGDPGGPGGHWVGVPQITVEITAWEGGTELGWVMPDDAIDLGRLLIAAGKAANAASRAVLDPAAVPALALGPVPCSSLTLKDADGDALKLTVGADGRVVAKTVHGGRPDATRVILSAAQLARLGAFLEGR